ncbi:alpha/beta hydrolase [Chitinophaga nivalis]|uniref:Alpha/beta hydrolase n=1 Tax=Chitinophaga nivalis TaxID=2991709 RepID=A0ABT3IH76_9BACT|nr:alpha/beta hydrolase [Chitinophaga nivalis]MCW3466986.1 alpha/beta hydrolase [Chitinophaga nivalis]MCW3483323.1 alpha/beta hydrolase [Chitinophaga nivalis]
MSKFRVYCVQVIFTVLLLINGFPAVSQMQADTAQKTVYLFSGIGADSSIFMNLTLPGYHKVYITWIPALPHESLTQYAGRIKSQITVDSPYIIGLSFGGIAAVEVSKQITVKKMVLISSVRTKSELNRVQFFFMKIGLYRIIPSSLIKRTNFLTYRYFGARSPEDKKALTKLLQDTDVTFFRWALKALSYWDNNKAPDRTIQIHGTADRVISSRLVHPEYRIKGGGHLMVLDKADTISHIITHYFGE